MGRRGVGLWIVGLLLSSSVAAPAPAARAREVVTARGAILIDNRTGEILWAYHPDRRLPPASTTKVATAIVALESGRLNDSLRVTRNAAKAPPSKIHLRPGWRVRLRDLVYAVLLSSANDASVVIAEGLDGSVRKFVARMNTQVRQLGATNTHFVNPHGLPAINHYSTARDLAKIFGYALQNRLFRRIVGTRTASISPTAGSSRRIALRNHNRLLGRYHIRVVGKTGWTRAAKRCFVGAATADGRELIVAVLGSRDLWGDLKRLLDFGFRGSGRPVPAGPQLQTAAATSGSGLAGGGDTEVRARRYRVRLASFRHLSNAKRLKKAVARKGYRARIRTIRHGRRHWYRVSIGTYASRRTAQRVANRVKKVHRGLAPLIVASN